jgi:hypothetical protein
MVQGKDEGTGGTGGRGARFVHAIRHELNLWFWVSAYLFVLFAAILLFGWAQDGAEGRAVTQIAVAAVQAVVLGKFVLMGKIIGIGTLPKEEPLFRRVLRRTFGVLLVVAAFVALEEMVVAMLHGRTALDGLRELAERGLADLGASMLLIFLLLLPLAMLLEFTRHFPPEEIRRILFGR